MEAEASAQMTELEQQAQILHNAPSLVYVYHVAEQRNLYANQQVGTVLGYSVAEIQNLGAALMPTLMHPEDLERLPNHHEQLVVSQPKEVIEFTYRMRHKNGEWRWFIGRDMVYTRLADGQIEKIIGSVMDITKTKTMEIQIRQMYQLSQALNKAHTIPEILQLIGQPAIDAGAFNVILFYTETNSEGQPTRLKSVAVWPETAEYQIGSRISLTDFPLISLEFAEANQPFYIANVLNDHRVDTASKQLLTQQFHTQATIIIPLNQADEWKGIVLLNWAKPYLFKPTEKSLIDTLPALVAPIIANQQLVEVLKKTAEDRAKTLQQSQSQNQALIDALPDLLFELDKTGTYLSYKAAPNELYLDPKEVIGSNINDLPMVEFAEMVMSYIHKTLDTGILQTFEYELPIPERGTQFYEARMIATAEDRILAIVRNITQQKKTEKEQKQLQKQVIDAQQRMIKELSIPIIPLVEGIIVMPLIGSIDSMRAQDLMRALLRGISEHQAKIVILDITGVVIIDTGIASSLDKTIQAARLKGARTIITGMSDGVAETIIDLGIDWSNLETLRNLQSGLMVALQSLGITLIGSVR